MATSRQASELATHTLPATSCECSRSTVEPDETNVTPPPRRRAPEPNTRSVSSNPARANSPSHTASLNPSGAAPTEPIPQVGEEGVPQGGVHRVAVRPHDGLLASPEQTGRDPRLLEDTPGDRAVVGPTPAPRRHLRGRAQGGEIADAAGQERR